MNNRGQFLLYDIILALFLIFIVLSCMLYVIEQEDDAPINYDDAYTTLNLLSSTEIHNMSLLEALNNNDTTAYELLSNILSDKKYTLKDLTINKTLSRVNNTNYHDVITAKKVVGTHEYELSLYV